MTRADMIRDLQAQYQQLRLRHEAELDARVEEAARIDPEIARLRAENRDLFEKVLHELAIPQPRGRAVTDIEEGIRAAAEIGYPVLVRPSFVLGGRAMQIVADET